MGKDMFIFLTSLTLFMIPIIAILTSHQQKMAALIHGKGNPESDPNRVAALEDEVRRLQYSVNALTMTVESLRDDLKSGKELSERIEVGKL